MDLQLTEGMRDMAIFVNNWNKTEPNILQQECLDAGR